MTGPGRGGRSLDWTVLRADAEVERPAAPDGIENMARDDALARTIGPGEGVVRFYRWRRPTLSFGRNEPATRLYRPEAELRGEGLDLVRRPTGGRAVLHDRELTYAVVVPIDALGPPRRAYHRINAALVTGLRRLGAGVELSTSEGVAPLDSGPCFQEPAEGEVVLDGRKLVGSAQVRIGRVLLQHGSILLANDQGRLLRMRRVEASESGPVPDAPSTLTEALDVLPAISDLVDALVDGCATTFGGDWRTAPGFGSFPDDLLTERRRHYASTSWTWRR